MLGIRALVLRCYYHSLSVLLLTCPLSEALSFFAYLVFKYWLRSYTLRCMKTICLQIAYSGLISVLYWGICRGFDSLAELEWLRLKLEVTSLQHWKVLETGVQ